MDKDQNSYEYIYMLREREFVNNNKNVYKIGRSKQKDMKRIRQYSKSSELIIYMQVDNCKKTERILIKEFNKNFKSRTDIGYETFEGDRYKMLDIIYKYCSSTVAQIVTASCQASRCFPEFVSNRPVQVSRHKVSGHE